MTTIYKKDFDKDTWGLITDEVIEFSNEDHRRGSTFYVNPIYEVTEEMLPDRPDLWGFWEGETVTWSDDYGMDEPSVLTKVHKVEKTIVTEEWQPV